MKRLSLIITALILALLATVLFDQQPKRQGPSVKRQERLQETPIMTSFRASVAPVSPVSTVPTPIHSGTPSLSEVSGDQPPFKGGIDLQEARKRITNTEISAQAMIVTPDPADLPNAGILKIPETLPAPSAPPEGGMLRLEEMGH